SDQSQRLCQITHLPCCIWPCPSWKFLIRLLPQQHPCLGQQIHTLLVDLYHLGALQQAYVGLQIMDARRVLHLEEVELQLDSYMSVAGAAPWQLEAPPEGLPVLVQKQPRQLGDRIADVHHPQHLHPELLDPLLEAGVADPWPAEGVHRDGYLSLEEAEPVEAELGEVVPEEQREGAPHAVPGHCDAHLLALVLVDEAGDFVEQLLSAAAGAEPGGGVGGGVEAEEARLDLHVAPGVVGVEVGRRQRAHEVGDPLGGGYGAAEAHEHVAPAEPPRVVVGGHGDVADPPAAADAGLHGDSDARRRVHVLGDLVAGGAQPDLPQHAALSVLAVEVAGGGGVDVERLVARGDELPVADDRLAQQRAEWVDEAAPVVGAMDLPPHAGEAADGLGRPYRARVEHRGGQRRALRGEEGHALARAAWTSFKRSGQIVGHGESGGGRRSH
ncbi:unnamed protein product, partial [Musa acuminata subsp. malaccensis]